MLHTDLHLHRLKVVADVCTLVERDVIVSALYIYEHCLITRASEAKTEMSLHTECKWAEDVFMPEASSSIPLQSEARQ